jgi:hypothetical protein
MAKGARSDQGAARAQNAKSAAPEPRYMTRKKPADIDIHKLTDVMALIEKRGLSAKFKRQAKADGHAVTLTPDTVNFIKKFLSKNNMHTDRLGRKAITSDGDYDCDT